MFAIKNLTTIISPQWFLILNNLELAECMIPRDITTHWNSTFDMLDFAVEHITEINTITADHDIKLRQYELSEDNWNFACQLWDVLKVWFYSQFLSKSTLLTCYTIDIQKCNFILFQRDTQHCHCHPCHGSHRRASFHCCHWQQILSRNQGCPHNQQKDS